MPVRRRTGAAADRVKVRSATELPASRSQHHGQLGRIMNSPNPCRRRHGEIGMSRRKPETAGEGGGRRSMSASAVFAAAPPPKVRNSPPKPAAGCYRAAA